MTGGSKIDPVFLTLARVLLVVWINRTDVGTSYNYSLSWALTQLINLLCFYKNFTRNKSLHSSTQYLSFGVLLLLTQN
jgi:hypothetical protein